MTNLRRTGAIGLLLIANALLASCAAPKAIPTAHSDASQLLFWPQADRDAKFSQMEKHFPYHVVKAGSKVRPLPEGEPLAVGGAVVDAFMQANNTVGLLVLQDGRIRLERYRGSLTRDGRWISFSVAKSFSSTLVGAAIHDGYIKSVDAPVTAYLPELVGSAYDGVSIAQLLTMQSGVHWNEDYTDANSDVAKMYTLPVKSGHDATVDYMKTLTREAPPGSKWVYKTGETNLIGSLVRSATHKTLANYLSEKIWMPFGMERDAYWMLDPSNREMAGCCLLISLRDYARMGQMILDGARGVVGPDWLSQATVQHAVVRDGIGYGYQWWTFPDHVFGGRGIFGQTLSIDPARKLVVVILSSWPTATGADLSAAQMAFLRQITLAADH